MTLYETLENHFNNLDAIAINDEIIFKSDSSKEYYESHIMFAFRKLLSLDYHLSNVIKLIKKESNSLLQHNMKMPKSTIDKNNNDTMTIKIRKESFEYIYELSAFLGSMKSCLDLLAKVSSFYLKGVDANYSITTILKLSARKKSNLLIFFKKNEKWIRLITEYRHPLLHRLVMRANSGYEIHQRGSKIIKVLYPVLIPRKSPKYIADTRRQRMFEDSEDSLINSSRYEQIGTIKIDGLVEIIDYKIKYTPSDGYVKIEDFMRKNRTKCEKYFIKLIEVLDILGFKFDRYR